MDCARNIITANFSGGTSATTAPLWQWDYGQVLCITGIDLPAAFEVHFSTNRTGGVSTTAVGADGQVTIPNVLLTIGKNINAWIYLSDSEGEGETEYSILIPVKARPMPETYDAEVTGEFDDVVRQVSEYAETAQTAADNAVASATAAAASADSAAASASAAETAKTAAQTAQGNAEDAQAAAETAAQTATQKAEQTEQDAAQAALDAGRAESAANRAETAETGAEAAKAAAEAAAQGAADSATTANEKATLAGQSATAAAQSAASIEGDVQTATAKAAEATEAAGQAVSAKDAAVTAQTAAEAAETNAGQSASTATAKAAEAATSASNAAASESAAEAAATRAEQAAATLTVDDELSDTSENPVQNKVVTGELTDVKSALSAVMPVVADTEASTNLIAFNDYSGAYSGINVSVVDGLITISGTATDTTNIYLYYDGYPIVLESGNYVATLDSGLILSDNAVQVIFYNQVLQYGVSQKTFSLSSAVSNNSLRIRFVSGTTVDWSGHFWINPNTSQEYIPKGETLYAPKTLVEEYQGEENSGKVLAVGADGNVTLINNGADNTVSKTIYERGNLLDYSEIAKGYIQSDGTVKDYNTIYHSGYVPMYGDTVYCNVNGGNIIHSQYFAFYDANKNLVASYSTIGQMTKVTASIFKIAVPEGAKYFRCSFGADQSVLRTAWISNICENPYPDDSYSVDDVYPYTSNPSNPCDYSELTVRTFSKAVCIGDSLTYGGFNMNNSSSSTGQTASQAELAQRYSYPTCFQKITGVDTTNKGTSGVTAQQWYTQFQSDDFSEFDLAIIFLGVNDSAQSVSDADTLTAMQNIVTMLNTARSDMRIAICSCIPAYDGTGYQAKGQLILNWAKGLNDPNIIPLDLAQYSHVRPKTSYVAGHCSALGYYMMALDIAKYISWYMDHHKRDFRFIQFIGSPDASWSGD